MMDRHHTQEWKYDGSPESISFLSNESGYISATPSLLSNDSPESENGVSLFRPTIQSIIDTPLTSQKYSKINSQRKLLQENCDCSRLEDFSENNKQVSNTRSIESEGSSALEKCFSQLLVEESVCDPVKKKGEVHYEINNDVFCSSSSVSNLPLSSKNKCSFYHGNFAVKKFKQDYGYIPLCARSPQTSYCGETYLDFFVHLSGISGCFPAIISQILSYLSPHDLVTFCKVSSEWRKVCFDDPVANKRRLTHVDYVKHAKENITLNRLKQTRQSLNMLSSSNKGLFKEIQNTEQRESTSPTSPSTPRSPPVSPSKVRFNLFMKAGCALDEGRRLVQCPRCTRPSQVTSLQAYCQSVGCRYKFCVSCLCDTHEGRPCPSRSVLPVRRKSSLVGSKESRRNLRRL